MNIHFLDKKLYRNLNMQTIASIKVGSHMYELNNEKSDEDLLLVYIEPEKNRNSFMWEHHQLQYKDKAVDYNFSSIQSFIRNALTGDSTINFEVIWSKDILETELSWLYDYRKYFINYNIIKSYLGMAKRDLKYWKKDTNNGKKNSNKSNKKLSHFVRGIIFANMLNRGYFTLDLNNHKTFEVYKFSDKVLLDRIKRGILNDNLDILVDLVEKRMQVLRVENNSKHEKGKIPTYMNINKLKEIDARIMILTNEFEDRVDFLDYGDLFYTSLEKGISY